MTTSNLDWCEWQQLDTATKLATARQVAASLPIQFRVTAVSEFTQGARTLELVVLEGLGTEFVLLPGGEVEIGFDVGGFEPSRAQQESYRESAEEYGLPETIQDFLTTVTTRRRTLTLRPMLVEMAPFEVGLSPVASSDPEVVALLKKHPKVHTVEVHKSLRVKRLADGRAAAWRISSTSQADLVAELRTNGTRLPTSDEWEFLCGAGAKTLFRWGDDCPCDRYPVDELSGRNPHKQRNVLGLNIAQDPYHWELVAEPEVRRGGDGGCNICGGVGFFLGWLPLATAYRDDALQADLSEDEDVSNTFARRVVDIEFPG